MHLTSHASPYPGDELLAADLAVPDLAQSPLTPLQERICLDFPYVLRSDVALTNPCRHDRRLQDVPELLILRWFSLR